MYSFRTVSQSDIGSICGRPLWTVHQVFNLLTHGASFLQDLKGVQPQRQRRQFCSDTVRVRISGNMWEERVDVFSRCCRRNSVNRVAVKMTLQMDKISRKGCFLTVHQLTCCSCIHQKPYGDLAHPGLFQALGGTSFLHTHNAMQSDAALPLSPCFSPPSPDRRRFPPLSLSSNGVSFIA